MPIPQLPLGILRPIQAWLSRLTDSSTPLLPFVPKPLKLLFFLLLLINSPSLPFLWHIRVWYYPIKAYWLVYIHGRRKYLDMWQKENAAAGGVKIVTKLKRVAWIDDCDYNLHLSNSAYAKNVDSARMQWCIDAMCPVFTPGCTMALGASHYIFFKEIPMGTEYVMESRLAGWGEKWMYLVTEFVIYPKKSAVAKGIIKAKVDAITPALAVPNISASTESRSGTPISGSSTPLTNAEEVKKAAGFYRARSPREDGGVVCCLAMTEYCFKQGRVTVPPRVGLFFSFLGTDPTGHENIRNILLRTKDRGAKWMRGGWKDEPNADTLGLDVGVDSASIQREGTGAEYAAKAREGMELVIKGLSTF